MRGIFFSIFVYFYGRETTELTTHVQVQTVVLPCQAQMGDEWWMKYCHFLLLHNIISIIFK